MWTQHGIDTEKLYFLTKAENKTDTKENILAAIYINLINMDNAITKISSWRQIINTKLFKGNRLLNTTSEAVAGWRFAKKVFLQIL